MSVLDHLLALALAAIPPLNQRLARDQLRATLRFGPQERAGFYRRMAAVQWVVMAVLLSAWLGHGRPLAALGLGLGVGARLGTAAILGLAVLAATWLYYRGQLADPLRRERLAALADRLAPFLPRARESWPAFRVLAVTAGICEEIIYRGYLVWYLSGFTGDDMMGRTTAVALAAALFALAHLYQGALGVALVFAAGLVHGALYLVAGSLWVPMAAHAALDLLVGRVSLALRRSTAGTTPCKES